MLAEGSGPFLPAVLSMIPVSVLATITRLDAGIGIERPVRSEVGKQLRGARPAG